MTSIKLDYSKISNVFVNGIDMADYGDFCDAYIESADYEGREMTEDELEDLPVPVNARSFPPEIIEVLPSNGLAPPSSTKVPFMVNPFCAPVTAAAPPKLTHVAPFQ